MSEDTNAVPPRVKDLPDMATAADLARVLQTTTRTIRRLVIRGVLPKPQRFGGLVRWQRQTVMAILAQRN